MSDTPMSSDTPSEGSPSAPTSSVGTGETYAISPESQRAIDEVIELARRRLAADESRAIDRCMRFGHGQPMNDRRTRYRSACSICRYAVTQEEPHG